MNTIGNYIKECTGGLFWSTEGGAISREFVSSPVCFVFKRIFTMQGNDPFCILEGLTGSGVGGSLTRFTNGYQIFIKV